MVMVMSKRRKEDPPVTEIQHELQLVFYSWDAA